MDACGDSPENGYTADYTPALATALDEQYDTDLISGDDTDYIGSSSAIDCTLYMGELFAFRTAVSETRTFLKHKREVGWCYCTSTSMLLKYKCVVDRR